MLCNTALKTFLFHIIELPASWINFSPKGVAFFLVLIPSQASKMISTNTITAIQKLLHPHLTASKSIPPALTGGLMVFMVILYLISWAYPAMLDSLKLQASTITHLERKLFEINYFQFLTFQLTVWLGILCFITMYFTWFWVLGRYCPCCVPLRETTAQLEQELC